MPEKNMNKLSVIIGFDKQVYRDVNLKFIVMVIFIRPMI